eukprot:9539554-Heterocapsa_arctica.AAC.1
MRLPADTWRWCVCSAWQGPTGTRHSDSVIRSWPTHEAQQLMRKSALLNSMTESQCDKVT